jgi:hypothetical protein
MTVAPTPELPAGGAAQPPPETFPPTRSTTSDSTTPSGPGVATRAANGDVTVAGAPVIRAFGSQPYNDVLDAARAYGAQKRSRGCRLSDARLAVMMISITVTEAGPLSTSNVAPPMTLGTSTGAFAVARRR